VILIQIDGGGALGGATNGLIFYRAAQGPSNYTMRGLCLTGFRGAAVTAAIVDSLLEHLPKKLSALEQIVLVR
ncbi:MAG: hypothetical protein LC775_11290, partial [Acidobacteria bacterium]|nr:hypothetical protein [Acidobacteriota bacterium]